MAEALINDFLVSVGGTGISSSTGTIQVSAVAPVDGGFRILIGAELMLVNSGGVSTTWNVSRGIESTTTAAHSFGDPIHVVMTAAGLTTIMTQYLIQTTGAWSSGTTYSQFQMVYWQGSQYISSQSSNTANQPDTSPSYWALFTKTLLFLGTYSSGTTYALNDVVLYGGTSYVSLLPSNTAHQPDISTTYWQILASGGSPGSLASTADTSVKASRPSATGIASYYPGNGGLVQISDGSNWYTQPITAFKCTPPPAASTFTAYNFNGAYDRSLVDDTANNSLIITENGNGSGSEVNGQAIAQSYPATPFTWTVGFEVMNLQALNLTYGGICIRNSSNANWYILGVCYDNNARPNMIAWHATGLNAGLSSGYYSTVGTGGVGKIFLRLRDDGTYRWFESSADGYYWGSVFNVNNWSCTEFLTPDQIGLASGQAGNACATGIVRARYRIFHWTIV